MENEKTVNLRLKRAKIALIDRLLNMSDEESEKFISRAYRCYFCKEEASHFIGTIGRPRFACDTCHSFLAGKDVKGLLRYLKSRGITILKVYDSPVKGRFRLEFKREGDPK